MKTYFYYLRDPDTNAVRYIGQSKNPKHRYSCHIHDAKRGRDKNTRKVRWIMKLVHENKLPVLDVFEEYTGNIDAAHRREWQLIKEHLAQGHDLVNGNDGGVPHILPDDRVKPVFQYEKGTGSFIAEYRCAYDAYAETGIKDVNISVSCKKEFVAARFPGGYIWSYNKYDTYPLDKIPEPNLNNKKRIQAINLETGNITEFASAREAAKELNIKYKGISACARGSVRTYSGYVFRFVDATVTFREDPIYKYSLSGEYVSSYSSASQLANELGLIEKSVTKAVDCFDNGQYYTCSGWFLSKYKYEKLPSIPSKLRKSVRVTNTETGQVMIFVQATLADKALGLHRGAIASIASGARSRAGKYTAAYVE